MNARKFKRAKAMEAVKKIKEVWKAYAKAEREAGRVPVGFKEWLEAEEKTW